MFSQLPHLNEESQSQPSRKNINKHKKRKRRHFKKIRPGKDNKHRSSHFELTMSSWAENFTVAATWQLKHQIAYWKSKAMALEYENRILHDIIKKNCVQDKKRTLRTNNDVREQSETDSDEVEEVLGDNEDDDNLEVSEEYITFLMENAKYKEDARLERERLKAEMESEENELETLNSATSNENTAEANKELYGKKWQRISALETSLQSTFISNCDSLKPMYWPNIPFNFNFS